MYGPRRQMVIVWFRWVRYGRTNQLIKSVKVSIELVTDDQQY